MAQKAPSEQSRPGAPYRIWLSPPHINPAEHEAVQQALQSGWISTIGPSATAFEKALSAFTGTNAACALSSGTAAIHMALTVAGVGPGDAVFCPALTFAATVNPVLYTGATPLLIDSETETWGMDATLLEDALNTALNADLRPKAVIPVHLYGMPCNMEAVAHIARKYNLLVIEDAAEAAGSQRNGKAAGSLADMGVFSFNGNKIITTSGGGALVSNNQEYIEKARFLSSQAREPVAFYLHKEIGYNYRLSNILAALGCAQLESLPNKVARRREIFNFYKTRLGTLPGVSFQPEVQGNFSNRWLTAMLIAPETGVSPQAIINALGQKGIEARRIWNPMHRQPVFSGIFYSGGSVADNLFETGLCLPSGSNLLPSEQEEICDIVRSLFSVVN